jgi:uncharacterized protein YndB with AHSA1/START domain
VTTRRRRVLAAPPERVWELVSDPYHHPRWWPRVARVEGVSAAGWTNVLISARGNTVRTDWTVEEHREPVERRWAQELVGTPFERLFLRNAVTARVERAGEGTEITLEFDQRPRGLARVMPFLLRRPMRRQLDEALDNLQAVAE